MRLTKFRWLDPARAVPISKRDHKFESGFLQRGVWCEPDFRGRIPSMTVGDFANARGEFAFATDSAEGFEPSVPPAKVSSVFRAMQAKRPEGSCIYFGAGAAGSARFVLLGEPFHGANGPCGLGGLSRLTPPLALGPRLGKDHLGRSAGRL